MQKEFLREKLFPLSLMLFVIAADQVTKFIVVKTVPPFTVGASFWNDFLRIIHVSNKGVAFSIGDSFPETMRKFFFVIIPLIVIAVVLSVYFRNNDFTRVQRWAITGIAGGGLGNLLDRFFRSEGVIDFIDVRFFGIFGLDRWPTFNVADASVVVCGILLLLSFLLTAKRNEVAK